MKRLNVCAMTSLTILFVLAGLAGANAQSITECAPAGGDDPLQYRCTIVLEQDTDETTDGSVNFTMPSMPLAHNMPPSKLTLHPTLSNAYTFDVRLDMFGEWMLAFDLVGPDADRFRQKLTFLNGSKASSAKKGADQNANHGGHGDHATHDDHNAHSNHSEHSKHEGHDEHNHDKNHSTH